MNLYEQLTNKLRMHIKARSQKHALYPVRFWVPDNKVSWDIDFQDYKPIKYNAPVVLNTNTSWADPEDIKLVKHPFTSFEGDVKFNNKIPLNPIGRTGICGRGVLGKWGANFAADGIITTIDDSNNFLVLTITRKDTGEIAFPGGMVDPGENAFQTRNRELAEETSFNENDFIGAIYDEIVYKGYIDDPRNTDNAWMETTAIHSHISYETVKTMALKAGDDAADFSWIIISDKNIGKFYANHGLTLLKALKKLSKSNIASVAKKADKLFNELIM